MTLLERLNERWERMDGAAAPKIDRILKERREAAAEIERLRDAAESAKAWLDNWAQHVGTCPDGQVCTCGLDAIRNEVALSLQPTS